LIPLTVFRNRSLTVGNIVMLLLGAAMIALFFALSVYMQSVLGYSALTTGLSQLPLALALIAIAGVVPAALARFGVKSTLITFLLALAAGLTWLAFAPADAVFLTQILGPTLLIGVGIGGTFVTTTQLAVEDVPASEAGLAGGLVNTTQQIGGALGLAVLSTVAATRTSALANTGVAQPEALTSGFSWLLIGAAMFALAGVAAAGFVHSAPKRAPQSG
jgi:MFS family permease